MRPTITATPDPVTAGTNLKVCYTFEPGQGGVTLTIRYDTPNGEVLVSCELTPEAPCFERDVPSNCTGVLVSDDTGAAEDLAVTVQP